MTTTAPLTPDEIRAGVLALFRSAPADVATDIADLVAAVECAHRPGAVVGTDVGGDILQAVVGEVEEPFTPATLDLLVEGQSVTVIAGIVVPAPDQPIVRIGVRFADVVGMRR